MQYPDEFLKCLAITLKYEGGNDDDPDDPGGRTSRGIVQREYNAYRRMLGLPIRDVWTADQAEIIDIYYRNYWIAGRCGEMPAGIDFVAFDSMVLSGVSQCALWIQRSIFGDDAYQVDGHIGSQTIDALNHQPDNDVVVTHISERRLAMLQGLKGWKKYGGGWGARVAHCRDVGTAWATGSIGPQPISVVADGGHKKADPSQLPASPLPSASTLGTITGGLATAGGVVSAAVPSNVGSALTQAAQTAHSVTEAVTTAQDKLQAFSQFEFVGKILVALAIIGVAATFIAMWLDRRQAKLIDGRARASVPLGSPA
jgi:lysozyme family protein